MLGIGGKGVHLTADVARRGVQAVAAPVGADDGGRGLRQSEYGLELSLHRALLLRLHVVAYGVGLRLYVVLLAVAEAVDGEAGLQAVAAGHLVDGAQAPAQSLVAHLVVGAADGQSAGGGVRAVGDFVGVVEAGVQGQLRIGAVGELLGEQTGAVAGEERGLRGLRLGVAALDVLKAVVAVAVGAVVRERRVGAEAVGADVERSTLGKLTVGGDGGGVCH